MHLRYNMTSLWTFILLISGMLLTLPGVCQLFATSQQMEGALATITRLQGDVTVLSRAASTPTGPSPHVLLNGKYYQLRTAKIGTQLNVGDLIQTGPAARARVVYKTGDQITIAAATSYQLASDGENGEKRAYIDLLFGKIRAMIRQRDDQQEQIQVRTKSMVMRVRGTDFFVAARNQDGYSQLSVMRGKVAVVAPKRSKEFVEVPAGYSLMVNDTSRPSPNESEKQINQRTASFQVRPTTKEDVASISQISRVPQPRSEQLAASQQLDIILVQKLESLALESMKEDIKEHQPELYQRLKDIPAENLQDSDLIQSFTTRDAFENAPSKSENEGKNRRFDLDSYGDDVYDRYLKH